MASALPVNAAMARSAENVDMMVFNSRHVRMVGEKKHLRRSRSRCHVKTSERLGRQVLAVHGDHGAVAARGVVHLLDIELEVDGAYDAVAELLVN